MVTVQTHCLLTGQSNAGSPTAAPTVLQMNRNKGIRKAMEIVLSPIT